MQKSIEFSLDLRDIKVRRPDTSLTAVVRGAVLCGIEKLTTKNLSKASACRRHYAISVSEPYSEITHNPLYREKQSKTNAAVVTGYLAWLFNKGDLILSDQPMKAEYVYSVAFNETEDRMFDLGIYSYDDDDRPERTQNSMNGMH